MPVGDILDVRQRTVRLDILPESPTRPIQSQVSMVRQTGSWACKRARMCTSFSSAVSSPVLVSV